MMHRGQQQALARRRAVQEQLALERAPTVAPGDACRVCLGQGGWDAPATPDEPAEWVECWACDPDPARKELA